MHVIIARFSMSVANPTATSKTHAKETGLPISAAGEGLAVMGVASFLQLQSAQ